MKGFNGGMIVSVNINGIVSSNVNVNANETDIRIGGGVYRHNIPLPSLESETETEPTTEPHPPVNGSNASTPALTSVTTLLNSPRFLP